MEAIKRTLLQQKVKMEVWLVPQALTFSGPEINGGNTFKIKLRIVRGPETWSSKEYECAADAMSLTFRDEEFKKQSGFYFNSDGAQLKKATILVLQVTVDGEEVQLSSNDINLSNLVSLSSNASRVEITKSGIRHLELLA